MPSSIRCAVPGYPHHIRQRGVRKQPLFYDDSDYLVYIRNLKDACTKYDLRIRSYSLMTNHIHVIGVPKTEISLSRTLQAAHRKYSQYFNNKYGFVGHAWQGKPEYSAMDEHHMWNAVRYVERNPVRARMVERAENYLWSSAAAHCGLRDDILLSDDFPPAGVIADWSEWLKIEHTEEDLKAIRKHLSTGRPWGSPEFIQQLEALTGRCLQLRKVGRPKKIPNPIDSSLFSDEEK
jgi:REP-associated tyrosine transposase